MTTGKLQLAEVFHSLQGEGTWVGTPMFFIRLAGCNVGRPASTVQRKSTSFELELPVLPSGQTAKACATYDGRSFWCDTDYDKKFESTIDELLEQCWERHICLTGGEPFLHVQHFPELFEKAAEKGIMVHIESSGTILPKNFPHNPSVWITCAPKIGCEQEFIRMADEVKLLVDARFHPDDLPETALNHKNVYLCPVNDVSKVRQDNFDRAYTWLRKFPHWKISWQAHKEWGYR